MKRVWSFILAVLMMTALLSGCSTSQPKEAEKKEPESLTAEKTTVKLATLQGPTGMGMAYLLDDADNGKTINKYEYTVCASPDEVTGKIVSGELDIAALPTNAAAALYNKTQGKVQLLALNTKCVLYILEKGDSIKSISYLKGKTVYVSGQGSTPEFLLEYLLEANGLKVGTDVKLDFTYSTHNDLVSFAASGKADVVLLPEPAVTALVSKSKDMHVALDLDEVWNDTMKDASADYADYEVYMGCVVVNTEFAKNNPQAVADFLKEYEASVDKINDYDNLDESAAVIAKVGIVAAEGVAKHALPRCNITFESGSDMKKLEGFLEVLCKANPDSVGGQMPDDNFYYKAS